MSNAHDGLIYVIRFPVGKDPVLGWVENELKPLQKLVGGFIERVSLPSGLNLICNEEGLLLDLPFNRLICGYEIYGDFFICRSEGADFASVEPGDLDQIKEWLGC